MTRSQYEQIAQLISQIRNARFGQMVAYLEELIKTGIWRDYTTPAGTRFTFRAWEFDYFLAAMEIDPDVAKQAYIRAQGIDGLAAKRTHLADITGHGRKPANGDRRTWREVADEYRSDPSGAGARIEQWSQDNSAVVTDSITRVARNPQLRKAYEGTGSLPPALKQRWHVDWRDDRPAARAIADHLLKDPDLAHEVYKILHSWSVANAAREKRRSSAQNGSHGPDHEELLTSKDGDGPQ